MTFITSHYMKDDRYGPLQRDIPLQESHYFASYLLKRDIELDQVETLTDDELDRLIAETKVTSKDREAPRLRKTMAAYFYEYAMRKAEKRDRK
tara:strand:+ start:2303 stop:2581 length:279 start_codon:yes stop_codon:yes gene_type:complete